jgi:hypothetical protein
MHKLLYQKQLTISVEKFATKLSKRCENATQSVLADMIVGVAE